MRVVEHPILDELDTAKTVTIYFDGMPVRALEGEPVAAALMNAGIRSFRLTAKKKEKAAIQRDNQKKIKELLMEED